MTGHAAISTHSIETFSRSMIDAIHTMRPHLPVSAPDEFRMADVKHWVRRRWPLPPESLYTLQLFVRAFVDDEGWICQPHGTEIVRVKGLKRANVSLVRPLPATLATTFEDGIVRRIVANWNGEERSFDDESALLDWIGAPADVADAWTLFDLERIEADEASAAWLDDHAAD